jgi:hypothetical protein
MSECPQVVIARLEHRVAGLEEALMTFLSNSSIQADQPFECESAEKLLKEAK